MKKIRFCCFTIIMSFLITPAFLTAPAFSQTCIDNDGDGFGNPASTACTYNLLDCDDSDATVYPFAPHYRTACDGKDTNCDGLRDFSTDIDADADGYPKCSNDCNDTNAAINPGIIEGPPGDAKCSDTIDNNCNWLIDLQEQTCNNPCIDKDGDGYYSVSSLPQCTNPRDDCDDNDPNINPGVSDTTCNNIDENCSGTADEQYAAPVTNCGVGICAATGFAQCVNGEIMNDCTPGQPQLEDVRNPLDPVCNDGLDNDCDGVTDYPADFGCHPCAPTGVTDDNCDGVDDDCNGIADDLYQMAPTTCGAGACSAAGQLQCQSGVEVDTCTPGTPVLEEGLPTAPICTDGIDNDCDGVVDECSFCNDQDNDGFGDPGNALCTYNLKDCDDSDPKVYPYSPYARTICDGKDTDCNGVLDFSTDKDTDGDGFKLCDNPKDCNDSNPDVNPAASEGPFGDPTCSDLLDNDCDLLTDIQEAGCKNPCVDSDKDGFFSVNSNPSCTSPRDDCNDSNASINPGVIDNTCNNVDNNCSGTPDDEYAAPATSCGVGACEAAGFNECINGAIVDTCTPGMPGIEEGLPTDPVCTNSADDDCDGLTDSVDPGCNPCVLTGFTDDNCDGIDDDCNGTADDLYVATPTSCGVGSCSASGLRECQAGVEVDTCTPLPAGTENNANPLAPECNDGLDNDCDTEVDECGGTCTDLDNDGFGNPASVVCQFPQLDCDDNDALVFPFSPHANTRCDAKDTNCDGVRDFPTDRDDDGDGIKACDTPRDCDDSNPNVYPGNKEGPPSDPSCFDGADNDCDLVADIDDIVGIPNCLSWDGNCTTRIDPKNGPHLFDLLDPADDSVIKTSCDWCHITDYQGTLVDERFACQRCHATISDSSNPLNGILKEQSSAPSAPTAYPLAPPYGFATALNVKTHLHNTAGPVTPPGCLTCHNPHLQEQDATYGTSYGKLLKEFICYDETSKGNRFEEVVELSAGSGPGSFADGPPHNENICEMCHTDTNHHRRTGDAPDDLDSLGNYIGHADEQLCTECHVHSDGFMPAARPPHNTDFFNKNCQFCHVETAGTIDYSAKIPNTNCQRCHGLRTSHTGDPVQNKLASGKYAFDVMCVDCHEPMNAGGNNHMFIRPNITMSVIPGSIVTILTKRGAGSLADGPPRNENICETCHSQTSHNRGDGTGDGVHADGVNYDGSFCLLCHDHNRSFMAPGKACKEENDPGINCLP